MTVQPVMRDQIERLTVRWRGPGTDVQAPALRLRAERHLAAVSLPPAGMPPAAVLVLRRVAGLAMAVDRPLPSPAWQAQVQRQMADEYRRAVRPAASPVPGNASAVLFSDEAELLACLTSDVLAGRARERWYWQAVWHGLPSQPGEIVAAAWSSRPAALPAALRLLRPRDAATAVALLDRHQVSRVVRSLHAAFALPDRVFSVPMAGAPSGLQPGVAPAKSEPEPPPWRPWPAREAGALAPQARYLLGLAGALVDAPAYARSAAFAERAAAWLAASLAWPVDETSALSGLSRPVAGSGRDRLGATERSPAVALDHPQPEGSPASSAAAEPAVAAEPGRRPSADAGWSATSDVSERSETPPIHESNPIGHQPEETAETQHVTGASGATDEQTPWPDTATWLGERVPTGLGGVLYLINLLQRLDLPHGWDDPALAEHVGGWALLEALGRAFLGGIEVEGGQLVEGWQRSDPLWTALAQLDGRPPEEPAGARLPQPAAFRLPSAWLARYVALDLRWQAAAAEERLWLWDAERGLVVVDAPLGGRDPVLAAAAEVEAYRAAGLAVVWQMVPHPPVLPALYPWTQAALGAELAWLVRRMVGFVRYWLVRALACPPHELDERVGALLAAPDGQVLVSRTHVDLYLPLERIDLAARRAGLDRDPGWVPDLGRVVSFHFM